MAVLGADVGGGAAQKRACAGSSRLAVPRGRLPRAHLVCYTRRLQPAGGNNSVVECDLAKVEVAGSNPVSRSIFTCASHPSSAHAVDRGPSRGRMPSRDLSIPTGAVAKW
jgi:hypothetical protein